MKLPVRTGSVSVGINMTPMIDIVFQLIIFFLVANRLVHQETEQELQLPQAVTGAALQEDEKRHVTINVLPNGGLIVAARPVSAATLKNILRAEAAQAGGQLEVQIRADRSVAYQFVEPVLIACVENQIWDVSFRVIKPE